MNQTPSPSTSPAHDAVRRESIDVLSVISLALRWYRGTWPLQLLLSTVMGTVMLAALMWALHVVNVSFELGVLALLACCVIGAFAFSACAAIAWQAAIDFDEGTYAFALDSLIGRTFRRMPSLAGVVALQGVLVSIGMQLLIIPGLIAATIFFVVGPVQFLEQDHHRDTFGRSQSLVKGRGGEVFFLVVFDALIFWCCRHLATPLDGSWYAGAYLNALTSVIPGILVFPFSTLLVLAAHKTLSRTPEAP